MGNNLTVEQVEAVSLLRTPNNKLLIGIEKEVAPDIEACADILAVLINRCHIPFPSLVVRDEATDKRWAFVSKPYSWWWDTHEGIWEWFPLGEQQESPT